MPTNPTTTRPTTLAGLKAEAEAAHAQFPQYKGHWDGWKLARITRRIRTKLGVAFEPGDVVLAKDETIPDPAGDQRAVVAYSFRNKADTSLPLRRYTSGRRAFEWLT